MRNTNKLLAMLSLPVSAWIFGCAGSGLGKEVRQDVTTQMTAADIKGCYEAALGRNRKVQGSLTLGLVVEGGSGKFTKVTVEKSDVGDPELERCVVERVSACKLAKPAKTNLKVEYPVVFEGVD